MVHSGTPRSTSTLSSAITTAISSGRAKTSPRLRRTSASQSRAVDRSQSYVPISRLRMETLARPMSISRSASRTSTDTSHSGKRLEDESKQGVVFSVSLCFERDLYHTYANEFDRWRRNVCTVHCLSTSFPLVQHW